MCMINIPPFVPSPLQLYISPSIQVERFRKEGATEKAKAIQVLATEIVPSYPTKVEIGDEGWSIWIEILKKKSSSWC